MKRSSNMKNNRYLTMEEKRQLALEGKDVPLCTHNSKGFGNEKGIVKTLKYIPNKKDPKIKL